MKRVLVTIMIVAILSGALVIPASAANYTHVADELNGLGLFQGTDSGYDLGSAPNRIQAVVMLIRLLGLETEALACDSEHPFADVSGWQAPYVAYAFENKLTTGVSDTEFNPNGVCTAQMYVTYVLRALGYSSEPGGEFTYAGAVEFGKSLGIIDDLLANGQFLRDQMVAVSYLALAAAPNGGDFACLLEKLAAEGAVAQSAAAALLNKLALFGEFGAAFSGLIDEPAIAVNANFASDAGAMGALLAATGIDVNMSADADMSMIRGDVTKAAANLVITQSGKDQEVQVYFTGDKLYVNNDGEKSVMDSPDPSIINSIKAVLGQFSFAPYIISDMSKDAKSDSVVYTVAVADGYIAAAIDMLFAAMGSMDTSDMGVGDIGLGNLDPADIDISVANSDLKFYTDSNGVLNKAVLACDLVLKIEMGGVPISLTISLSLDFEVTGTGDDVTVDFPDDLDDYS